MILPVFIAVRAVAGTAPCTPWVHTVGGFYEPNPANNLAAFSNLSLAAATEWCCNSQLCAGFSFVNETESGYYKGHPLSYYYVGAGFDGYAKPGEVPKPGPTPPPSPPPPPPPACIYPAGNSQECVDPYWKGTPPGVTAEYDCALRMHAWAFAQKTMPRRGSFKTVYDALQLQDCPSSRSPSNTTTANTTTTTTTDPPAVQDVYTPPTFPTPTDGTVIYVDAGAAAGGDGSKASPFASLELAVEGVAGAGAAAGATIVLRAGTYYTGGILLTHQHSGLTIQNYEGEDAAVSGAVQVPIKSADKWAVHSTATNTWRLDLYASHSLGCVVLCHCGAVCACTEHNRGGMISNSMHCNCPSTAAERASTHLLNLRWNAYRHSTDIGMDPHPPAPPPHTYPHALSHAPSCLDLSGGTCRRKCLE